MSEIESQPATNPALLAGEWGTLQPLPDRALWWPEQKTLFIADLHLGKDSTFRQQGLSVPIGSSPKCLNRLSDLSNRLSARRVVILGDLFHARSSLSPHVVEEFGKFLTNHSTTQITLVKGNHDIHTGKLPSQWNLLVLEPPVTIDRIMLTHFPQAPTDNVNLCIAGHLHPAVRLRGEFAAEGRLPCFVLSKDGCLTLPAFGEFVGSSLIKRESTRQAWIAVSQTIIPISANLINGSSR